MLKEKVENQPETNQWFDEMVSNLRVDQLLLQADVLERQKKEVYEAMIMGNQDFMHKICQENKFCFFYQKFS